MQNNLRIFRDCYLLDYVTYSLFLAPEEIIERIEKERFDELFLKRRTYGLYDFNYSVSQKWGFDIKYINEMPSYLLGEKAPEILTIDDVFKYAWYGGENPRAMLTTIIRNKS